ncbi:MAG TPA: DMT family transporter [Candidatus Saccharimonadales bacterium]|nr:DMT family transporter [Candidatus Saccharimonadales bacterium]
MALLFFHLVGIVGNSLILRQTKNISRFALSTISQTGIAIPALALLIISPPQFSRFDSHAWLYLLGAMVLTICLQVTYVKALEFLEASVFSVVYNLRMALTTVLSIIFLGESFDWLRIAGGGLILLAIFVVRQRGSERIVRKGVLWGLAAVLSLSFLNLCEKKLINSVGFFNYFPLESLAALVVMWLYLLKSEGRFDTLILVRPKILQLMAFRALSAYGFSGALALGASISVANYISGINVIFMMLFGALLLGERDFLKRKIAAVVVAVVGLTLVLIGSV